MTKSKPVAPKRPKPVLAWCLLLDGEIAPHCCRSRRKYLPNQWGPVIRVEIRPAPKRKGARK